MKIGNTLPIVGILLMHFFLSACKESNSSQALEMRVTKGALVLNAQGKGKIEAVASTDISIPQAVLESQVISWIAPENTYVKKGDIVLRFDNKKYIHDIQQEDFEIAKANIDFISKELTLSAEENEISDELNLVDDELQLANQYSVNDSRVYSKNDVIDNMKNLTFLQAKQEFSIWRSEGHKEKSVSELDLLRLRANQHKEKLSRHQTALKQLVVKAPHDGIFILERNWRDEKPRVGETVWPGRKVASLPNLAKLQARVAIPESEAMGIKVGQRVELMLDAKPETIIPGTLNQIDSVAKARSNKNPVKFFEATVTIPESYNQALLPGSQLKAIVYIAEKENTISIPKQAIHYEKGQHFVYRLNNGWHKQPVKLGLRGSSVTEIVEGLNSNDTISIIPPGGNDADH